MVDSQRRAGDDVFVIHVRSDAHDASRPFADVDEIHHRIGPHDVPIDSIFPWKHALRDALANDHNRLAASAIVVIEIASGNNWHTQRGKKSRRNSTKLCPRIFLSNAFHMALAGEPEAGAETARVTPGRARAESNVIYPGHRVDAAHGLPIEIDNLIGSFAIRHHRYVQCKYAMHIEAGLNR